MKPLADTSPSLRDLLLRSDFARAAPHRVDELLDRCADPLTEDRSTSTSRVSDRARAA